jgi:hypothetical protein
MSTVLNLTPSHFDSAEKLAKAVTKAREESILSQLNDFISRELIEVRIMGTQFVRIPDSTAIEYREVVKLVLKDREYIEKIEKENAELKSYVEEIKKLLKGA